MSDKIFSKNLVQKTVCLAELQILTGETRKDSGYYVKNIFQNAGNKILDRPMTISKESSAVAAGAGEGQWALI